MVVPVIVETFFQALWRKQCYPSKGCFVAQGAADWCGQLLANTLTIHAYELPALPVLSVAGKLVSILRKHYVGSELGD